MRVLLVLLCSMSSLLGGVLPLPGPGYGVAPPQHFSYGGAPVVQDTPEVARARDEHLAAVARAKALVSGASGAGGTVPASIPAPLPPPVPALAVQHDTVEVAAAKAKHLAAVEEAKARLEAAQLYHYPNVPGDFPRWDAVARFAPAPTPVPVPVPAPVPAWDGRYNSISTEGQYVADDEGRYIPQQNDEGQYNPSQNDEGQYDVRLNAEGQYIPSLNDEGQWVPSANEGQYVQGRDDLGVEDNMPYSYSYSDGLSSKSETKTPDGITRGRFSYVDANGVLQTVEYEADNIQGFRASGTNLPRLPEQEARRPYSHPAAYSPYSPAAPAVPAAAYSHATHSSAAYSHATDSPAAYSHATHSPAAYSHETHNPAAYSHADHSQAAYSHAAQSSDAYSHATHNSAAYSYGAVPVPAGAAVQLPQVPVDTPEVAAAKAAHFAAHREAGARLANAYSG